MLRQSHEWTTCCCSLGGFLWRDNCWRVLVFEKVGSRCHWRRMFWNSGGRLGTDAGMVLGLEALLVIIFVAERTMLWNRPSYELEVAGLAGFSYFYATEVFGNKFPNSFVKLADVKRFSSGKKLESIVNDILDKPYRCSSVVRHQGPSLQLDQPSCVVKVHCDSPYGLVTLTGESKENHCLDNSISIVNFSSDVSRLNPYSSYFKVCTNSDIAERRNGNLGIEPSRTLYIYILTTWTKSDGVVSEQ